MHLKSLQLTPKKKEPLLKKRDKTMQRHKLHSIKVKFTIAFICFALIPLISICIIYTFVSKHALKSTSKTLNAEIVHISGNLFDTELQNLENTITQFVLEQFSSSASSINKLKTKDNATRSAAVTAIKNQLSTLNYSQKNLKNIGIISDDFPRIIGTVGSYDYDTLKAMIPDEAKENYVWLVPEELGYKSALVIKTFSNLSAHTAYTIIAELDLTQLTGYLDASSLLKDSKIYLTSRDHTLLFTTDSQITALDADIESGLTDSTDVVSFNSKKSLISYVSLSNGWKIIVETPSSSLTAQLDSALILIMIIFVLILVLANALGMLYGAHFSKPIIELKQLMKKAELGDLTVAATVSGNDEITELCKSFNHMIANMKAVINQTQDVISHASNSSQVLYESTTHSVETMRDLSTAVAEIAEGTTMQATDAQKSNGNMTQLSSSMEDVTQHTCKLIDDTSHAKDMIQNATSTISSLTQTMDASLTISHRISGSISQLSSLHNNIQDIIKLLEHVSEETNLLALNASIEAARVGDAGKGFAVVANEIRRLADQSKSSTASVYHTLAMITDKMQETVSFADRSQEIIEDQHVVVQNTQELFEKMIHILTHITNQLETINKSIQTMQNLKSVTASQIDNIASVTEESAAATEQVNSMATEQQHVIAHLSEMANTLEEHMQALQKTIQTFKVQE